MCTRETNHSAWQLVYVLLARERDEPSRACPRKKNFFVRGAFVSARFSLYLLLRCCFGAPARRVFPDHLITCTVLIT